jgi:sugar/nucleoside kinase (ribokinase family)
VDRKGILATGNWIVDQVKVIDAYPAQDKLANILSVSTSNGGSPYNILKNLSRMGAGFPLEGAGLLGEDGFGTYIIEECLRLGIDTRQMHKRPGLPTSITDVMTVLETGRRTFFHARGANSVLQASDIDLAASNAKIFHLGYLLLLTALDELDENGKSGAAVLLEKASRAGFKTSVDVVSESSDRFAKIVRPSLPFTDYLFVNEYEAGQITGLVLEAEGKIQMDRCKEAIRRLLEGGVREWVFLHFPQGALAGNTTGEWVYQPALSVPSDFIKGAAGAGDAFASGVLFGIHEGWHMQKSLSLGVCSAAASLSHSGCSDGLGTLEEVLALATRFGFQPSL